MAEDERTVESTAENGETADREDRGVPDATSDRTVDDHTSDGSGTHDDAAETFLELDADLDSTAETPLDGLRRGLVADAARVDAAAVPGGYPLSAETEQAVELTVDFGDGTTTVYLAWPDDGEETALTWLLDAMRIDLAGLYGREVLVERTGSHDTLVTPDERPRGSDTEAGIVGGLGVVAGFLALLAITGSTAGLGLAGLLWALVTLVGLPYATYRDAWYLRTRSDWEGGPLFWATLSMLPFLNLLTGAAYLRQRSRATFFGTERSVTSRVAAKLREWL